MHNLFDLYQQYMLTQDKELLGQIAASYFTYSVIKKYGKINYDGRAESYNLEKEEVISQLYIRLTNCLHKTSFTEERAFLAYIDQSIKGIILSASTRDNFKNNVTVVDNYKDQNVAYTYNKPETDESLTYFIQTSFPALYDHFVLGYTKTEVMEQYNLTYRQLTKQIEELRDAVKIEYAPALF